MSGTDPIICGKPSVPPWSRGETEASPAAPVPGQRREAGVSGGRGPMCAAHLQIPTGPPQTWAPGDDSGVWGGELGREEWGTGGTEHGATVPRVTETPSNDQNL